MWPWRRVPKMDPKTVLVVDDEPHVTAVVEGFLRPAGYVVVAAQDGQTALEQARAQCPDVIMLDLDTPGHSGWEVLERLQADAETRDVPVLLMSNKCINWDRLPPGVSAYLTKPFGGRDLRRYLRRILEAKAAG